MGSRSRKRGRTVPRAAPEPAPPGAGRPRRLRGAEADDAARAQLEPLAPGERPTAVTVAAVVAALLGLSNIVLVAAGYEIKDGSGGPGGGIVFGVILFVAAAGMWKARYWAVLGFQTLLVFTAIIAFLSLLVASNLLGAVLSVVVLACAGTLFYKLIRQMARIQMPSRTPPR